MRFLPLLLLWFLSACATGPNRCAPAHAWLSPATLRVEARPAGSHVVLLGEHHDSPLDHAWQLATIRLLYAADPSIVLGFEMFPRAAQPALDLWVAGRLAERDFLASTDWRHVWGFPPELYLPIFRFARDHRLPMLALNVSRRLVHRVGQLGWAQVPAAEREGIGTPAPPSAAYRQELAEIMAGHGGPPMSPERLSHFVDAQSLWDRAMAEAIASQRASAPGRPVVALIGAGHLENRWGVPHQLEALNIGHPLVLIPLDEICNAPGAGYADAIYTVGTAVNDPPAPPRS